MSSEGKDTAAKLAAEIVNSNSLAQGNIQDILNDPTAMASISQKLASAININLGQGAVNYPPRHLRRIKALKNIQKSITHVEAEFYKEVQALEAKYIKLYQPYYDRRESIVSGKYEPTDDECQWVDDENEAEPEAKKDGDPSDGIPDFWLTAFKNCDIFADVVKEGDEELLSHLADVKVVYADDNGLDFSIEYYFSENEWFTNKVLTMTYFVTCEVSEDDPWAFEGATIYACHGCQIDWKKGKDLTVKTIKKKSKGKGKGQSKQVTKQVPNETFFNMFSFTKPDKSSEQDDAVTQALSDNYNRAEFIRDRLVPRAVLFFTGEAVDEDDEFDSDYEEEEGGDAADDYNPQQDLKESKPPECKQQ